MSLPFIRISEVAAIKSGNFLLFISVKYFVPAGEGGRG